MRESQEPRGSVFLHPSSRFLGCYNGPMPRDQPLVVVLGGINGAGKTTTSGVLLGDKSAPIPFVNADTIACGLNAVAPERAAVDAGRIMLNRLNNLAAERADFAFETTLAGRSYISFLRQRRAEGYRVELHYLWLPSPEMSVERVRIRVQSGGHHIPEHTIRQRFPKTLSHFWKDYRPLADTWAVYTNWEDGPSLTATGSLAGEPAVAHLERYQRFLELIDHVSHDDAG